MRFGYGKIPVEMRSARRWVLWRLAEKDGRKTKIPVDARTGYGAKSNDPDTWVSFEEAMGKADAYACDGLGFMLGNGYFGVDIDHAKDKPGLIAEFADTLRSYTEISQSGEGLHIVCKGVLPQGARRKGAIEMYDSARFFALTGNVPEGMEYPLADRTEEIKPLWEKYLGEPKPEPQAPGSYVFRRETPSIRMGGTKLSDDEVVKRALESKRGSLFNMLYYGQWEGVYPSQSEADAAFCSLLAFWTGKDAAQMDRIFRSTKLYRPKWDNKRGAKTYGEMTIGSAIAKCQDVYQPGDSSRVYDPSTGEVRRSQNYDLDDTGNAKRFVDRFGEGIRYNFDNKTWMVWDGRSWAPDVRQTVKGKADVMIGEMKEEAFKESDEKRMDAMLKNIKHLASSSGKEAMLKEAMHMGSMPTTNADYDRNKWMLNCANGTVDLRTGTLLPHDRSRMISKCTNVDCDLQGSAPTWEKCLRNVFKGSEGLVSYVRKAIGYSLTGSTKEQCFFQCHGDGSNGKSVFFNTLFDALGGYALNAQVDSILTRKGQSSGNASPDIARMKGARFVRTNEPSEGARFNEGLVKQLTGGDVITARFLYGTDFEFRPEFKLWIACNYKIAVRGTDKGIWRRVRLIPFEATFEGASDDKDMEAKLKKELPQILGWAVKGCLEWQREGLTPPEEVEQATKAYRQEMDIVEAFCKDRVERDQPAFQKEAASDVYRAYKDWAVTGNEWLMSQSKFGIEMGKKFEKKNVGGRVYYMGMKLRKEGSGYGYERKVSIYGSEE